MEIVQSILEKGNVYIAARCSQLLVATFAFNDSKAIITVHSDRGIDHLLMVLVGKVTLDQSLIDAANKKYSQSLSITNIDDKARVLESSYTKFSYPLDVKQYRVSIKQILVPELNAIPGVYRRRAYGGCIKESFAAAIDATPQLLV